jgi:ubiquinone/menaquinone biosynthesis C-methylase UbiE
LSTRAALSRWLDSQKRRTSTPLRNSSTAISAPQSESPAAGREKVAAGSRLKSNVPIPQSQVKGRVQRFWQNSPCDSWFTNEKPGTFAFYRSLDEHRYKVHPRLQSAVGFEKTKGLRVLEIGCGCGSEAERFARAGAHYTAIDLTNAAVSITRTRFQLEGLQGRFTQGDAENLPFADSSFDLVYSHGVLHHTPDTPQTIREVHRVLAPGGRAVIMLYYRNSFNYHVNVRIVRRLRAQLLKTERGIQLARKIWHEPEEELRRHADLIRQDPDGYLDMQNMLNRNTDGPDNPLSQVFSRVAASNLFSQFENVRTEVMFWNPNWLPGIGRLIPQTIENWLASHWGWHLWIFAHKTDQEFATEWVRRPARRGLHPQVHSEALAG